MAGPFSFSFPLGCTALVLLLGYLVGDTSSAAISANEPRTKSALSSIFVDDVIVESTLSVRRKAGGGARQGRARQLEVAEGIKPQGTLPDSSGASVQPLRRDKRQNKRNNRYPFQSGFPQGFGQFQVPSGSASSAAAQAQGFQAAGPLGGFGASSAGAGSQGFSYGEDGFQGNAGLSGSQSYNLPNGQTLALSFANGFSIGPDGKPTITRGNSLAFTGPGGKPVPGFGNRNGEEEEEEPAPIVEEK